MRKKSKAPQIIRLNPRRRRAAKTVRGLASFLRRHRGKIGLGANGVLYAMLVIVSWGFSGHAHVAIANAANDEFTGIVTRVVDGDTFRLISRNESIRLWGLDAPETDERGGADATAELARLAQWRIVHCTKMDRDRYGRIVARCLTDRGDDITEMMIESGKAKEYTFYTGGFYAQRRFYRQKS